MRIAVFDSDERMKIISERLEKYGEVVLIDEDDSLKKLRKLADTLDVCILPAWGIEDSGFVRMRTKSLFAAEFLEILNEKCVVFSGKSCFFLGHLRAQVKCWLNDEELLMKNAQLTAEGMLCRLIETTKRSLFTYQIDLIGTGRCAKALSNLLDCLKIPYRFVSSSKEKCSTDDRLILLDAWCTQHPSELVVNTAPVCVIHQQVMKHWEKPVQVYDLSTGCTGVDKKCLKHPFLKFYEEPALPSRYAVESAALLVSEYIERELGL